MKVVLLTTTLLVSATMGLALAHALEFPGKRRLDEQTYRKVQTIYYPGFTVGGLVAEVGGLLILPLTLLFQEHDGARFLWLSVAFAAMVLVHATYWLVTHRVNRLWLEKADLPYQARAFFATASGGEQEWKRMRDRWEYSHVARAVFGLVGTLAMALALLA